MIYTASSGRKVPHSSSPAGMLSMGLAKVSTSAINWTCMMRGMIMRSLMTQGKLAAAASKRVTGRQMVPAGVANRAVKMVTEAQLQEAVAAAAVGQPEGAVVGVLLDDAVVGAARPQWRSRRCLSHWSSLKGGWHR